MRELVGDGCGYPEIARVLGRTAASVRKRGRQLRLRNVIGRRQSHELVVAMLRALGRGLSVRAAARACGTSHSHAQWTVRDMLRRGLVRRVGVRTMNVRYVPVEEW